MNKRAAVNLLNKWLSEHPFVREDIQWEKLKQRLNENRLSNRERFPEKVSSKRKMLLNREEAINYLNRLREHGKINEWYEGTKFKLLAYSRQEIEGVKLWCGVEIRKENKEKYYYRADFSVYLPNGEEECWLLKYPETEYERLKYELFRLNYPWIKVRLIADTI